MEKSGFVYIWRDRKNWRYYVGSHWGTENDGYICSSTWMRKAYRRRPTDFKRRVIARVATSRIDLLNEEQRWLQMMKPEELRIRYYNLMRRADHLWHADAGKLLTVGEKISRTQKERYTDPALRAKASIIAKEAMARPDVRENYLKGLKTRVIERSAESLLKQSESMKEYLIEHPQSEEKKRRIAATLSKKWVVVDPNGEEETVVNLKRFARAHNLDNGALAAVADGKRKHHKGWSCRRD